MDAIVINLVGYAIWAWGSYEAWNTLTARNNIWLNTRAPLNMIVKIALCVALGFVFFLIRLVRAGFRLARAMLDLV